MIINVEKIKTFPLKEKKIQVSFESFTKKERYFKLFKSMGFLTDPHERLIVKRVTNFDELYQSLRIVHDEYVNSGFILSNEMGLRIKPYDTGMDSARFIVKEKKSIVGTLGFVSYSPDLELPSAHIFPKYFKKLLKKTSLLCEATGEAIKPAYRKTNSQIKLFQLFVAHAISKNYHNIVISASPGHKTFYRFLNLEQIGDIENYSSESYDPVVFMHWDLRKLKAKLVKKKDYIDAFFYRLWFEENPFFDKIERWDKRAKSMFNDSNSVLNFFLHCKDLFLNLTPKERKAIERRLGSLIYHQIVSEIKNGKISKSA